MDEDVILNDSWTLFFHDPYDNDWSPSSYQRICDIMSIQEFWETTQTLGGDVANGAFFLMRQDISPQWEDPSNVDGGTISIKVLKKEVVEVWEMLSMLLTGESLMRDKKNYSAVNGISITPKKFFCVIKIWIGNKNMLQNVKDEMNFPSNYKGEYQVRQNKDGNLLEVGNIN
jgi:hypothetical protein